MQVFDMRGKTYGALTAVEKVGNHPRNGNALWRFTCSCGADCVHVGYDVRRGRTVACKACAAERTRLASVIHGKSNTREFSTWTDIQTRCYNPNSTGYANYGGRCIVVCERWRQSFANFLADMGERPPGKSIDRIDNDGPYSPENCRWATREEQARNKRNNVWVEIEGEKKTLSEWCRLFGVRVATASLRHRNGYRGAELFHSTKPLVERRRSQEVSHGETA